MGEFLKGWVYSGIFNFVLGLIVGWIILKRPQWAEAIIAKIKSKIPGL